MRYSLLGLVLLGLTSTFAMAASMDMIAGTKHNFSTGSYAGVLAEDSTGQAVTMCQPCHTPHHAMTGENISMDLWNHALSEATYTLYDGTIAAYNASATGGDNQGMDRVSRLCLGCHDGEVALDAFGTKANNYTRTGSTKLGAVADNLGTNFTDDHPVGVTATYVTGGGMTVRSGYKKPTYANGVDATGGYTTSVVNAAGTKVNLQEADNGDFVVGCKTCHNPHGTGLATNTPFPFLLRTQPVDLCLTCHYK